MDLQADLDADYAQGLAEDAIFDGATAVRVFFDLEYVEHFDVAGAGPVARGRVTQFPSAAATVNKQLVIRGVTYTVRGYRKLDDGLEVLLPLKV